MDDSISSKVVSAFPPTKARKRTCQVDKWKNVIKNWGKNSMLAFRLV